MSRVVILGAGVSGHTAAAFARKWLDRQDEVVVVSPLPHYNWIPSNIWVGVGLMQPSDVTFPLAPVYERHRIEFRQARARGPPPRGPGGRLPALRRGRVHPARPRGGAGGDPVRLPRQRHRAEAQLRRDGGARAGTPQPLGLHREPRRGDGPRPRRGGRAHEARRAPAVPRRHRPRHLHLRGRGLRVHRQPRVRAARPRGARPRRDRLDHQRVRARRLRHGRHAHPQRRLRDAEQDLHRVAVRRARDPLDHPRPRAQGRAGPRPLRDRRRARRGKPRSTSPCSCRPSPGSGSRRSTAPAPTSRRRSSSRTASCRSTPTTRRSRTRSGRRGTGRAPTSRRPTRTSSRPGSPSPRRTRSRGPGRARAARRSRPRRRAPACPRR